MTTVERLGSRWWAALAALLVAALALRLWGYAHGLPYVYNADENAHFVTRAVGMFDHGYNPHYFINPPGFTYLLHVLFWLRWGGDGVQATLASDPGAVYGMARVVAALLGTAAVGFLGVAGARLLGRGPGLIGAALLAFAFLPVHYSHYALNDVPALAPLSVALLGIAGILRRGAWADYALAGLALGVAIGFKYTTGIVVLAGLAAVLAAPAASHRLPGVGIAAIAVIAGFLLVNPFALLASSEFLEGLKDQSAASNDGGGKLGLSESSGFEYYAATLTWGLGWLALVAAVAGAVFLVLWKRRLAWVLLPAVLVFLLFMGSQDRFFARWLLPIYPLLCLLAGYGVWVTAQAVSRQTGRVPRLAVAGILTALVLAQGIVHSVHNSAVLSRPDTRALARQWLVEHVPTGEKIVVEPMTPDQWAMDPGGPSDTGTGNRWIKWPTSRSLIRNDGTRIRSGKGRYVRFEDYERTTRPDLIRAYEAGGYCTVVIGSTQYGRAFADPDEVPQAIEYYAALERRGEPVARFSPYDEEAHAIPFSFDFSFNYYPFAYARPGPEITIYRLSGGPCATNTDDD